MSLLVWEKPTHTDWTTSIVGTCERVKLTVTEFRRRDGSRSVFQVDWSERTDGRSYPSFHTSKAAASRFIKDELNTILSKRRRAIR